MGVPRRTTGNDSQGGRKAYYIGELEGGTFEKRLARKLVSTRTHRTGAGQGNFAN